MDKDKEILQLKKDIESEERDYNNCLEYPTQTTQFYNALSRQNNKIISMKQRLQDLEAGGFIK